MFINNLAQTLRSTANCSHNKSLKKLLINTEIIEPNFQKECFHHLTNPQTISFTHKDSTTTITSTTMTFKNYKLSIKMTSPKLSLDSIEKLKVPSSTSGIVTNLILNKMRKAPNLWIYKTKIPMKTPKINLVSKNF